jgi:general stress protein 26
MGELKHMAGEVAIDKIKEMAEDIRICMFCTEGTGQLVNSRPMATQKVEADGSIWFLSSSDSHKNDEVKHDSEVQLLYSKPGDSKFMTIGGVAQVTKDRKVIDEVWSDIAKAWFPGGKDDPFLTAICVMPRTAYYWDTQHGKMVSMIKIAASAISGKSHNDDSQEGRLHV